MDLDTVRPGRLFWSRQTRCGKGIVKILSLAKYSLDVAEIKVDPVTHSLRIGGAPLRFGDLDKGAVEAAVRLKEATGATVEVLCFGPPSAPSAVRDLLAMGADEATIVEDPYDGSADGAVAARVLAAAIVKRGPFDVIICGFASDDGYSFQTGPRLAEALGLPLVSYACKIGSRGRRSRRRPGSRRWPRNGERRAAGNRERRRGGVLTATGHFVAGHESPEEADQPMGGRRRPRTCQSRLGPDRLLLGPRRDRDRCRPCPSTW